MGVASASAAQEKGASVSVTVIVTEDTGLSEVEGADMNHQETKQARKKSTAGKGGQ